MFLIHNICFHIFLDFSHHLNTKIHSFRIIWSSSLDRSEQLWGPTTTQHVGSLKPSTKSFWYWFKELLLRVRWWKVDGRNVDGQKVDDDIRSTGLYLDKRATT